MHKNTREVPLNFVDEGEKIKNHHP